LVTGYERGDGSIRAAYEGKTDFKELIVLPTGTYKLTGQVTESNFAYSTDARVEAIAGPGAGQVTKTDEVGAYTLYGVAAATTIRVTKDGYQPQERTLIVAGHQRLDFDLPLFVPPTDISGTYTLTITGAHDCRVGPGDSFPEEARVRRYSARVVQGGRHLSVVIVEAASREWDASFQGLIEPGGVTFNLRWLYDPWSPGYYPEFEEELSTSTSLVITGTVSGTALPHRLDGTLDGTLEVRGSTSAWCYSPRHQFVFSR
jgi:hypothetical protein